MKFIYSLRFKLMVGFIGLALLSVMSLAFITNQVAKSEITSQAGNNLSTLAHSQSITVGNDIAKQIELLMAKLNSQLMINTVNTANAAYQGDKAAIQAQIDQLDAQWREADAANNDADPLVQSVLSNDLANELLEFQKSFPEHVEVFVTDKYGASVASTGRTSDYNQADEDWWQATYKNGSGAVYIGQPEFDESSVTYAVNIGVPVQNVATGEVIGVLRSTYNIRGFNQILASVRFGETGKADLIFPSGEVITSDSSQVLINSSTLTELQEMSESYVMLDYRGTQRVVSQALVTSSGSEAELIKNLGWNLVAYQDAGEVLQPVTELTRTTFIVSLVILLIAICMALIISQRLAKPISSLTEAANQLAAGDLSIQARVESRDEFGKLAESFNHMTEQLRLNGMKEQAQQKYMQETIDRYVEFISKVMQGKLGARLSISTDGKGQDDPLVQLGMSLNEMTANLHRMIAQTAEAAANLSSAATEIMAATTQQASGATEQSAAITQTTTTVNEVKTISEQSSLRLKEVANTSQRTAEVARTGQKAVQEMIESMTQIKERVEAIAENTLALSEQTQQIGEIITTVNEIAAQSNILALNASVEAARAGEHGKGFAVVAMEVRNLAEQSKQATAQVRTILSEIQKATNSTVMATEEGAKGVDGGVQLAAQTRESIEKLGGAVNEATQVAMQVVAGGQQLQTGIEQIAMAIQQINQVTMQSLASTRQTEKSAQNLNELAQRLNEDVTQYEL
jgi:methyl-accepting chemotaxis protein